MNSALNDMTKLAGQAVSSAIKNMNAALETAPPEHKIFFSGLNDRLQKAMTEKNQGEVTAVQKDIFAFIERQKNK